jgi:hypothetical protein
LSSAISAAAASFGGGMRKSRPEATTRVFQFPAFGWTYSAASAAVIPTNNPTAPINPRPAVSFIVPLGEHDGRELNSERNATITEDGNAYPESAEFGSDGPVRASQESANCERAVPSTAATLC